MITERTKTLIDALAFSMTIGLKADIRNKFAEEAPATRFNFSKERFFAFHDENFYLHILDFRFNIVYYTSIGEQVYEVIIVHSKNTGDEIVNSMTVFKSKMTNASEQVLLYYDFVEKMMELSAIKTIMPELEEIAVALSEGLAHAPFATIYKAYDSKEEIKEMVGEIADKITKITF